MSKSILYIEDNRDNAIIINKILSKAGYTVTIAKDGLTGIALAEQHQLDLIISDFHLPGMNGPEVVKAIREKNHLNIYRLSC